MPEIFQDRKQAGEELIKSLERYLKEEGIVPVNDSLLVLAIPRGGQYWEM